MDIISHETDAQKLARIEDKLRQVSGLDFREAANYHRALDIIYLTGRPHWIGHWDNIMQTHFSRYDVRGDSDEPWVPLVKIAFGFISPPLTNSQNNRVTYAAKLMDATVHFNFIAPSIIEQPTHLLNELGKRKGKGKPSIDRCVDSLEAYRKQKPVSKYSNEFVPVPDPRKFPPPPIPPTGTADDAIDMVYDFSRRYAEEDAEAGDVPIRGDFKPDPPDGYRWSPDFLDGWTEADYPKQYSRIFYTARATTDATRVATKWAKEDFENGAPKRIIEFAGRSPHPVYGPIWIKVAHEIYNAWLDERRGLPGPIPPIPGPIPPVPPIAGPILPGPIPPVPPGPGIGPVPPGPLTEEQQLHQALAKAIAYKKCGKYDEMKMWAERLVELLEDGDYL